MWNNSSTPHECFLCWKVSSSGFPLLFHCSEILWLDSRRLDRRCESTTRLFCVEQHRRRIINKLFIFIQWKYTRTVNCCQHIADTRCHIKIYICFIFSSEIIFFIVLHKFNACRTYAMTVDDSLSSYFPIQHSTLYHHESLKQVPPAFDLMT